MRGCTGQFRLLVSAASQARRGIGLFVLLSMASFVVGCEKPPFENRQAVEGTVTIDGQPLPKALISFIPINETKGPKASGTVIEGKFRVEAANGPCPGEYQVKIETITPEIEALAKRDFEALRRNAGQKPPAMVAPEFNVNSTLQATVREGAVNRFEYAVKSVK